MNFESPYPIDSTNYQLLQIIVLPTASSFVDAKGLAETIKDAPGGVDIKGRGLFSVEGAEADVVDAGFS